MALNGIVGLKYNYTYWRYFHLVVNICVNILVLVLW